MALLPHAQVDPMGGGAVFQIYDTAVSESWVIPGVGTIEQDGSAPALIFSKGGIGQERQISQWMTEGHSDTSKKISHYLLLYFWDSLRFSGTASPFPVDHRQAPPNRPATEKLLVWTEPVEAALCVCPNSGGRQTDAYTVVLVTADVAQHRSTDRVVL